MLFYYFIRTICNFVFLFFCRIKVYGKENIPKEGSFLLASNHISYLDPMLVPMTCPRRISFMARDTLFKGFIGFMIKNLGAIPVKRASADRGALKKVLQKLETGMPVLMFPEGTRHKEKKEVKSGIGFLSAKANVPIVPVFIKGADDVLPPGSKSLKYGLIEVFYGEPIHFDASTDLQVFSQQVMNHIYDLSKKSIS